MRDRIRVFVILLLVLVCFSFIYAIRNLEKADVSGLIGIESPFLASLAGTDDIDSLLKEQANSPFLQKTFGSVKRAIFDSVVPSIPGIPVSLSSLPDLRVIDLTEAYVVENVPFSTYLRSATSNFPPQISVLDWKKLEDHIIYGEEGTAVESQYLRFRDPNTIETGKIMFGSRDDVSADYFTVKKDEDIFEYEMKFGGGLRSKLDGKELIDLKEETLKIINREYEIYDTEVNFTRNEIKIDLLGGLKTYGLLTLEEGIPHLVKLPDREIIIVPKIYDNIGKVVFNVNGNDTKALSDKEIDDIDGLRIGVVSILLDEAEEVRGGDIVLTRIADFQEGRFRLYDSNYADNNFTANGLEVDGENVLNSFVQIKAGVDTVRKDFVIDSIKYRLAPDSDLLVGANENMRNLLPQKSMFFDFMYLGGAGVAGGGGQYYITENNYEDFLKIYSSDKDEYRLAFTAKNGKDYDFAFFNTSRRYGNNDGNRLRFTEPDTVADYVYKEKDILIISNGDDLVNLEPDTTTVYDKYADISIIRYDKYDHSNKKVYFTDLYDGSKIEVSLLNDTGLFKGDLLIDGKNHKIQKTNHVDSNISVDLNGDNVYRGNFISGNVTITLNNGAILRLKAYSYGYFISVIRDKGDFIQIRNSSQVINISLNTTSSGTPKMGALLYENKDLNLTSLSEVRQYESYLTKSGDRMGITSFGDHVVEFRKNGVLRDIIFFNLINKQSVGEYDDQGLGSFAIR